MEVSPRTKPVSLNPINSDIKYSQPTHSFAVITLRDSLTFLRKIYKKKKKSKIQNHHNVKSNS